MKRPNQALPAIFALTAVLLLALNLNQAFAQQRWSIGPRVGTNISNQMGDRANNVEMKSLLGWSAGGFIMYSDIRHFGLSADVLFSQKGTALRVLNGSSTDFSYKIRINYLEIPALARYFLTLTGTFRPNFFIGPSVAFRLNAKLKDYEEDNIPEPDRDVSSQIRPIDLGLVGGIALNYEITKGKRILFDARYTYGLLDTTVDAGSLRNSAVTLNLSYGFGIGKKYGR